MTVNACSVSDRRMGAVIAAGGRRRIRRGGGAPGRAGGNSCLTVMDSWSHEQDIRSVGFSPGPTEGSAVEEAVAYFSRFLPYLVGNRATAPDGAKVFRIGARPSVAVEVAGGRAMRPWTWQFRWQPHAEVPEGTTRARGADGDRALR